MPNWCENDLFVTGGPGRVQEFPESVSDGERHFDFNRLIPYPEEFDALDRAAEAWWEANPGGNLRDAPRDGFNSGGYEWCVKHWGTKWNAHRAAYGHPVEEGPRLTAVLHFDTAWSPPLPIVKKASERFPDLDFDLRFYERGMCVQGRYQCRGGEVVASEESDYFGPRGG